MSDPKLGCQITPKCAPSCYDFATCDIACRRLTSRIVTSEVATQWPARLTKVVAGQISRYRHARGMSVQQLADAVTNLGLPIQRPVLSNLENGRRYTISVAELLALAAALRVPPLLLVTPIGETDQLEVLPDRHVTPLDAYRWAVGETPLPHMTQDEREDIARVVAKTLRRWWFHAEQVDRLLATLAELKAGDIKPEAKRQHSRFVETGERILAYLREEMRADGQIPPQLPPELEHVDQIEVSLLEPPPEQEGRWVRATRRER